MDATQGPSYLELSTHERSSQQAERNCHALLAARCLGRLAGVLDQGKEEGADGAGEEDGRAQLRTKPCQAAKLALTALLTEALAPELAEVGPGGGRVGRFGAGAVGVGWANCKRRS